MKSSEKTEEKRFEELYDRAYDRGIAVFSQFLNMEEQSVLKSSYLPCVAFGGYESAERVVAGFGEDVQKEDFPITCVAAKPVSSKFADKLTHRDFLGAVMNLGIKRELIGDIVIFENVGYIMCLDKISDYLCENLTRIRHTTVKTEPSSLPDDVLKEPEPTQIFVASERLDVIISAVYRLSRSEAVRLLKAEKIFVNSRLMNSASHTLAENDVVSVRGYGRFVFLGTVKSTKKGRLVVEIKKY